MVIAFLINAVLLGLKYTSLVNTRKFLPSCFI